MSEFFARPALPLEICELCIDALADTAKDDELSHMALAQCLRVSHGFCTRSRQHVFSHVHIQVASAKSPIELVKKRLVLLLALMISNDGVGLPFSITKLIKSFTLDIALMYKQRPSKIMRTSSLKAALEEFLNAEVLQSLCIFTDALLWDRVNPTTQNLIHRLCRARHFKALSLPGIHEIPTQFWEGATIQELTLREVRLGIPTSPSQGCTDFDTLSSPPDLDSLKVVGVVCDSQASFRSSSHSDAVLPFSRLRTLTSVIRDPTNLQATQVITVRSYRSLYTLHLFFHPGILFPQMFSDRDTGLCDLNQLPNLRHLKLSTSWDWHTGMVSVIERLCQFIPQQPGLKTLSIQINLGGMDKCSKSDQKEPWKVLKKNLIQSRVPRVEVVIKLPPPKPPIPGEKTNWADIFIDVELFTELRGDRSIDFMLELVRPKNMFSHAVVHDYYYI